MASTIFRVIGFGVLGLIVLAVFLLWLETYRAEQAFGLAEGALDYEMQCRAAHEAAYAWAALGSGSNYMTWRRAAGNACSLAALRARAGL